MRDRRRARRLALALAAGCAWLALTASSAFADAFVDRQPSNFILFDGDGASETMTVTGTASSVTFTDTVTIQVSLEDQDPGECTGDNTTVVTCESASHGELLISGSSGGASGQDTFTIGASAPANLDVEMNGLDGNDVLTGASGTDDLDGGAGDDTLNGASNADILRGGQNPSAPPDTDTLNGGDGNDTLENSVGPDNYNGGNETDEVDYSVTPGSADVNAFLPSAPGGAGPGCPGAQCDGDTIGADVENVTGDDGDDFLSGSQSSVVDNVLSGLGGNDQLRGGNAPGNDGADHFFGGSGTDSVSYALQTSDLVVDIGGGANDPNGDIVETSVEELRGGQGDDTLTGDDDAVTGDTLNGGFGDDVLQGSDGTGADAGDVFIGGEFSEDEGGDTVTYGARTSSVAATIGNGADDGGNGCPAGVGCENDDVRGEIENLIGGTVDDTLIGDSGPNSMLAGDGDDTMRGGQGTGADGADSFDGQTQATALGDTVSYLNRTDNVVVAISSSIPNSDGDVIAGSVDNVTGGAGNDAIGGDNDINTLDGRGGSDSLFGDQGDTDGDNGDTFIGGDAAGAGTDTVSYANLTVEVTAEIGDGANDGSGGCPGAACEDDDVQGDVENLLGGSADDSLLGDDGANRLDGRAGDDELNPHPVSSATPDAPDVLIGGSSGTAGGQNGALGDQADFGNRTAPVAASIGDGANDGSGGCPGAGCEGDDVQDDVERLTGGSAGDTLTGNSAANQIAGFGGGDVITGAGGPDDLRGLGGADTINARDGEDDTIDCGTEVDLTAQLDLLPLDDPATGCESVNRAQFVPPAPPTPPAPPPVATPPVAGPALSPVAQTTTQPAAKKKCKKGFKRVKRKGKVKCVKKRRKRR